MSDKNDEIEQLNNQDDQDPQAASSDQETGLTLEAFYEDAKERIRFVSYQGEPWYSIIDVIGLLTDALKPRKYWFDMKRTIHSEGFTEVSAKIRQLRMLAPDGKLRLTDAANEETLLRIIQSIPSPKAEPFKQWLAQVGHAVLEERRHGLNADEADQLRRKYQRLGYSDRWIDARLQGIVIRDELTQEWHERGAHEGREFAILTETLHVGRFDVTTAQHRQIKHIGAHQELRDSLNIPETLITSLTEEASKDLHQAHDSQGFDELRDDARVAGAFGGKLRREYEALTGRKVVSPENYKTLRQARQRELQSPLFPDEEPDATPEE